MRMINHKLRRIWLDTSLYYELKGFILWSIGPFVKVLYQDLDGDWYNLFQWSTWRKRDIDDPSGTLLVLDEKIIS